MTGPLSDVRVVEVSAFIAAPLGGMTLAQLGADVIRIDQIGGNIDIARWPLAPDGSSLYWASLNKAKRSVCTGPRTSQRGQELAQALICAPGEGNGTLLTNLPGSGWMDYRTLAKKRADLIMLRLTGSSDGSQAIDYTVNSAAGFPTIANGRTEAHGETMCCPPGTSPPDCTWRRAFSPPTATAAAPARARRSRWRCPTSPSPPSRTWATSPTCRSTERSARQWAMIYTAPSVAISC